MVILYVVLANLGRWLTAYADRQLERQAPRDLTAWVEEAWLMRPPKVTAR